VSITGDAVLYASFQAHLDEIGEAINLTAALKDPINSVASKGVSTFSAIGDVGLSGAACFAAQAQAIANVQASISVSVSASATVSGG
jgi:hypothetical protein